MRLKPLGGHPLGLGYLFASHPRLGSVFVTMHNLISLGRRELDQICVKGKNEPVRIFEILAAHSNGAPPDRSDLLEHCIQGLGLYVERRFEEARVSFEALARDYSEDDPTALYMERCAEYAQSPPPVDWDGVYTMKTK